MFDDVPPANVCRDLMFFIPFIPVARAISSPRVTGTSRMRLCFYKIQRRTRVAVAHQLVIAVDLAFLQL